ncbi:MAG: DegV family protein [Defluviitaleaceae bacterium]|nr:DegV family protein [Defluviitaleaceae bacterium]MCL2240892.1 DegV family protein [Defluviitaleaceae bacterium]
MSNYVIITDSTTDLPQSKADEWGIEIIPFIFNLDGKEYFNYLDWRELSVKNFYNALREGKTGSTTQVNQFRYMEIWEPHLKAGKDVFYMCLSSQLSKSYDQSLLAAEELRGKYPERKIVTIDTKGASLGMGLLAYYAAKARDEGKSIQELTTHIEKIVPIMQHWVMADDLHHLRRGGRVSGAAAFMGTMLNIKPIIHMTKDGKLTPMTKMRGRNKALEYLLEQMTFHEMSPKDQPVYISHSDAPDMAEQLKNMIIAKHGQREFVINEIGPVIGAHTGPGTIALFFIGNERRG